jgi:plastocyanin
MKAVPQSPIRTIARFTGPLCLLCVTLAWPRGASAHHAEESPIPSTVKVVLSEWKVQQTPAEVPPGPIVFEVTNIGDVPHAYEIEGHDVERSTPEIQPGESATLTVDLPAGRYEAYCPVGEGSHKMLGMVTHLVVGNPKRATAMNDEGEGAAESHEHGDEYATGHDHGEGSDGGARMMKVTGDGPVIQILPGPFPFADSAMAVISKRPPDQQADLTHKAHMGPYSNNIAKIAGDISVMAIDRGASGDSVSGVAEFTAEDGKRWKVVMDRVQTRDIPFNPRFGGVITGLFYHGASGVHTPLVPTIQSSLALWAFAHLYMNDQLVTDDAMVHIMLLSRTRRTSDWALDCWDCSERPIEELQLQVTAPPNSHPFDAPGGFLFVNWEKSSGQNE